MHAAQLVEHRTGIAEVTGLNPVQALIFPTFLKPFAQSIRKLYVEGTLHIENEFNNNTFMLDCKTHTSIYLLKHINLIEQETKGCK